MSLNRNVKTRNATKNGKRQKYLIRHRTGSLESAAVVWAILERISGFHPSLAMIDPRYLNFSTDSFASPGISVTINEHSTESISAQKHLVITIDKTLTWEQQIDSVCRNVSRKLALTKLLSKYVSQNSLKQYYNSYVLPVFDFGYVVWGNTEASAWPSG